MSGNVNIYDVVAPPGEHLRRKGNGYGCERSEESSVSLYWPCLRIVWKPILLPANKNRVYNLWQILAFLPWTMIEARVISVWVMDEKVLSSHKILEWNMVPKHKRFRTRPDIICKLFSFLFGFHLVYLLIRPKLCLVYVDGFKPFSRYLSYQACNTWGWIQPADINIWTSYLYR